ncbi:TRAPP II complex [Pilobolus umbonatus]|nr:TRAPP II complex [Pilobolus umbonatus]
MDLALDITASCRVRILLVPVSPIKKSTFWHHVELVKKFSCVRLGDVTPDLQKGASAKFSSQAFQEGQMHFQFVTQYNRDHCHLEDFQPHRRIFGVIGIMDCQEWKEKKLSEGYKKFVDMLDKYPTAVATRCFAFDPNENQPDDTKGLIMIPNVGNMSFYMSTMICDFASEILDQFATIAERVEKLQILESPIPAGYKHLDIQPLQSSSSPNHKGPRIQPTPTISSSFLKRAATTANRTRTPPPAPKPTLSRSNTTFHPTGDAGRTMQRTPGRIKKLLADFYLLAGRLPDAIEHYNEAIDMSKGSYDYLWLANAEEGLACTKLLMAYLRIDHIVARTVEGHEPTPSHSLVNEVMEMYERILLNYQKVNTTTTLPLPKLVYIEACFKMARFLTVVLLSNGWNDKVLTKIIRLDPIPTREGRWMTMKDLITYKQSPIQRSVVSQWITKIWTIELDDLSLMDQVNIMTHMASLLSHIGYHRKSAWTMYETLNRMLPLLIQGRAVMAGSHRKAEKEDDGILEVLKKICEVYGIGESHVQDGGTLELVKKKFDEEKKREKPSHAFGWATLQIDILRECIVISEALGNHASMLYYTTVLLKNLYQYISKDEQIRLASSIQRIVNITKRSGNSDNHVNYWGFNIVKSITPIQPIPRKAIYQHPMLIAKALAASKELRAASGDPFIYNPFAKKKDEKPQMNLIQDETCEFKVHFTNPFGFDLELTNIVLSTTGIRFSTIPNAAVIPANDSITIRLMGIPLETGSLVIKGCVIKITGFAEQEFLIEKMAKGKPTELKSVESKRYKYSGLQSLYKPSEQEMQEQLQVEYAQEVLNVIEDQPLLKIKSTSLLHGAIMLFEGEMKNVSIEVENIGNIPVDFLTLSFTDSTTIHPKPMNPELPTEEQYEIELYVKGTHVFSWEGSKHDSDQIGKRVHLPPGQKTEIIVNIYGKQGCTGGAIHIDYGYLDRVIKSSKDSVPTTVYTRQLYLPIMITVYQNLEPLNWDVLYLRENMGVSTTSIQKAIEHVQKLDLNKVEVNQPVEQLLMITQQSLDEDDKNPYCLIALDIRNTWTVPFDVQFSLDNMDDQPQLHSTLIIQPGSTTRLVLPLKKLFLTAEERLQPIPSFEPNKQFVVSQAPKMAPEQERARLQMFWYREQLLRRVKARWRCRTTGREGTLHLRSSLRLTSQQLNILKKQDIEFIVSMSTKTVGHRQFECNVNTFVTMQVTIYNRQGKK